MGKYFTKCFEELIKMTLKTNANSTTSTIMFQPKVPTELEKFKKNNKYDL